MSLCRYVGMYEVAAFRETRVDVMHALMRAHPLAALVMQTRDGLAANHIPLLVDPDPAPHGALLGHVARGNPLWRECHKAGIEVLAIFQGPQGYVTPSWYLTKQEHGKVVPTWNYAVVHAHGSLIVHDDAQWLRAFVTRLTERQESVREKPWAVSDAPEDYIATMVKGIVGIEIPIRKLEGKWKLSQNCLPQDKAGVISGLEASDDDASQAMLRAMQP